MTAIDSDTPMTSAAEPLGQRYRRALARLVELVQTAAAEELRLEQDHAQQTRSARQRHERLVAYLQKRSSREDEAAQRRLAEQREAIEAQFQRDFEQLRQQGRERLEADTKPEEERREQLQRRLDADTAKAEGAYETVDRRLEAIRQRVKEQTITRRNDLEDLREQGLKQLRKFGLKALAKEPMSDEHADAVEGDPKAVYERERQEAEHWLASLKRQPMARLVSGYIKPLIAIIALSAAFGWAVLEFTRAESWQDPVVLLQLTATVVVVTVTVALFKLMARSMVKGAYEGLRASVATGRKAADLVMERAAEERARELREADKVRRAAVDEVKQKWEPKLKEAEAALRQKRSDAQHAFEQRSRDLEKRRDRELHDAEQAQREAAVRRQQLREKRHRLADERLSASTSDTDAARQAGLAALHERWDAQWAEAQQTLDAVREVDARVFPDWDDAAWNDWTPPRTFVDVSRFGRQRVDLRGRVEQLHRGGFVDKHLPEPMDLPAALAFPDRGSMLLRAGQDGRSAAIAALQTAMARLLTSIPAGRVRLTMVDPVNLGQSFAGFMHLADHLDQLVSGRIWTDKSHIEEQLADLTEHMENVIQKYLRNEYETIDQYNREAGELAEPYRFLVVSDFPHGFTEESIRRLNSIAASGPRCGVYTLIFHDTRQKLPREVSIEDIEQNAINLHWEDGRWVRKDILLEPFRLSVDPPPGEEMITRLCHLVGAAAVEAGTVQVPFNTIAPKPEQRWTRSSAADLDVPVGRTGATRLQHFNLGHGVAQHALIAGKTGSGKSTLLHVLITNLALWYSPDEVEFYLVDFKKGVEFKAYANRGMPHARAIAIESDREFGLSVLQRLDAELTRRGDLYRRLGVQDMAAYRKAAPGQALPRILLVVDEFQEFFSEEDKLSQDAALLLDRLVRQGRAFGIHVLLGSQSLGGAAGLPRTTMGQMAVRVALQCSEADSQLILGDTNSAARLLARPGEAIYNDQGGAVEANSPFQISWLSDSDKDKLLAGIDQLAAEKLARRQRPIVFEGNARAAIEGNALLADRLETPGWPAPDGPVAAWIGEPVAIKEPTSITFRRQSGSNVLIVGQQDEAALSMMMAAITSLAAQHAPGAASFYLFDGSLADAPTAGRLEQIAGALPHETRVVAYRDVEQTLTELAGLMKQRQESDATEHPPVFIFIYGLQRYRMLRKSEDDFSFSMDAEEKPATPDKQLRELISDGPGVSIHVAAWCDTPIALERVVDRTLMREFDNRVLFQMSATDSSNIIDSPSANSLGFYRALWYSEEQGILEKFRPYALPSPGWVERLAEQFQQKQA